MKPSKLEIINRKAKHDYFFDAEFDAGIILTGTEIKSIREGHAHINDAYCSFEKEGLMIRNMYIKEYKYGTYNNHEPRRKRQLLLKKTELKKLLKKVKEKGFSIIPYKLYLSERGYVKILIELARGKKSYDKRNSLREKDDERKLDRIKKQQENY